MTDHQPEKEDTICCADCGVEVYRSHNCARVQADLASIRAAASIDFGGVRRQIRSGVRDA